LKTLVGLKPLRFGALGGQRGAVGIDGGPIAPDLRLGQFDLPLQVIQLTPAALQLPCVSLGETVRVPLGSFA